MCEIRGMISVFLSEKTRQRECDGILTECVCVEPSDDEWEEMSSSDESEMCADGMSDTNSSLFSPLCMSAELHTILLNHNIPQQVTHIIT